MKDLDSMEKAKNQVEEVTDMMRGNMNKIMEREGKLEDLEMKADQLQAESQQFHLIIQHMEHVYNIFVVNYEKYTHNNLTILT